ncbi:hypothetical protein E2C01_059405 [Portunus trituberculatus]|uniref:Uncharacterized protein n=1 Tax=Portunus trituberculatus TaxID=210409 RepID=A0A5B7H2G5_PORTR|nr:hypothetical protein [Portunus trituberculatus]
MEAKISACICIAKVLAGNNNRRLQVLIPMFLKYNNPTSKPLKSHQPLRRDNDQPCHEDRVEEAAIIVEDEEDVIVDVESSDSEPPLPIAVPPSTTKAGKNRRKRNLPPRSRTIPLNTSKWTPRRARPNHRCGMKCPTQRV